MAPEELRAKIIQSATANLDASIQSELNQRVKVADLFLKEKELKTKENMVEAQMKTKVQ